MIRFTLQRYNFFSKCVTFVARFYHVKKQHKNMYKKMKQNDVHLYPPNLRLPVARLGSCPRS